MTDTQVQSQQENEPEAVISEWSVRFTCPLSGRVFIVGPADFCGAVIREDVSGKTREHIHLLVRCLCGNTHNLEVE